MTGRERVPRPRWAVYLRTALGAVAVAVPVWTAVRWWAVLAAGHPAYPLLLLAVAAVGAVLLARRRRPVRTGRVRGAGRVTGALLLVALVAVAVWLRPYPADAVDTGPVDVVHRADAWELRPRGPASGVGVVFHPGALVDPRAYLPLLAPLAEQGAVVVVPAPPLGLALTGPGATARAVAALPGTRTWVVGGHSMGGVAAARAVDVPGVRGLLLWASYPAGDLSGAPVAALSVSGSRDGLATPDTIAASRSLLPARTRFVEVAGGVHAYFGDYGAQSGDGVPGVDRAGAQQEIVAETTAFVRALRPY
ncbi:alpha/beta hydrolase [Pseudonocardia sp. HH130630-07]|uniref:alpha/beta hydrolase n=1 Tax=Pseudonocardia sp. HH130630-07 TaxID=1690815 RepID=UPI000ADD2C2F|nr:alpha/beta hydrolase [Pseudonocardia sp. HH130630-07]